MTDVIVTIVDPVDTHGHPKIKLICLLMMDFALTKFENNLPRIVRVHQQIQKIFVACGDIRHSEVTYTTMSYRKHCSLST